MNAKIVGLLAETPIHPGSGQDTGFVDLPVARESATDYPVIVGSSLKGALRDRARQERAENFDIDRVFGKQDDAGQLLVGDGRLLLLPVRSLTRSYCWITCPHLLERLGRDLGRAGNHSGQSSLDNPGRGQFLGLQADESPLFLEERQFARGGDISTGIYQQIRELFKHAETAARLEERLVILNDNDFVWFARFGLTVQARNVLDEVKKTSQNLWYEETIPPDALFYSLWGERAGGTLDAVVNSFEKSPYLQVGGNETVGQGWFAVKFLDGGAA